MVDLAGCEDEGVRPETDEDIVDEGSSAEVHKLQLR